jgi:hypothetical protein
MRTGDEHMQTREEAEMSESFPANNAKPIPQITALSTAFPMHFESTMPTPVNDARSMPSQANREPHRHDAGE